MSTSSTQGLGGTNEPLPPSLPPSQDSVTALPFRGRSAAVFSKSADKTIEKTAEQRTEHLIKEESPSLTIKSHTVKQQGGDEASKAKTLKRVSTSVSSILSPSTSQIKEKETDPIRAEVPVKSQEITPYKDQAFNKMPATIRFGNVRIKIEEVKGNPVATVSIDGSNQKATFTNFTIPRLLTALEQFKEKSDALELAERDLARIPAEKILLLNAIANEKDPSELQKLKTLLTQTVLKEENLKTKVELLKLVIIKGQKGVLETLNPKGLLDKVLGTTNVFIQETTSHREGALDRTVAALKDPKNDAIFLDNLDLLFESLSRNLNHLKASDKETIQTALIRLSKQKSEQPAIAAFKNDPQSAVRAQCVNLAYLHMSEKGALAKNDKASLKEFLPIFEIEGNLAHRNTREGMLKGNFNKTLHTYRLLLTPQEGGKAIFDIPPSVHENFVKLAVKEGSFFFDKLALFFPKKGEQGSPKAKKEKLEASLEILKKLSSMTDELMNRTISRKDFEHLTNEKARLEKTIQHIDKALKNLG